MTLLLDVFLPVLVIFIMTTFGAVLFAVHLATMIPLALWIGRTSARPKTA
jgi:hypothetical protein